MFNEEFLVTQMLSKLHPQIKQAKLMKGLQEGADGLARQRRGAAYSVPIPANLRAGIKQTASMYGKGRSVYELVFPGSKI